MPKNRPRGNCRRNSRLFPLLGREHEIYFTTPIIAADALADIGSPVALTELQCCLDRMTPKTTHEFQERITDAHRRLKERLQREGSIPK